MAARDERFPPTLIEVLRFCIVAFLAAVGYQVSTGFGSGRAIVGVFDAQALGVLLGGSTGYVIGGVVARLTYTTVTSTESLLSGRSAEQLLAGLASAVVGVLGAAALTWPVLLVGSTQLTVPLFLFVVVTVGTLGYRLGLARRDAVLGLLGGAGRLQVSPPVPASLPMVVDTSVAIDGRVVDIVRAGFLHGRMIVPEPVLGELQAFADSADDRRRAKGRRGLAALEGIRQKRGVDLEVVPDQAPEIVEVDAKLVHLCQRRRAALLTLDTNLARVASVAGCQVLNLHALALAMRPPVLAGDRVALLLTRPGKEPGQAVGYLDDGTMVVVERGRERIGQDVEVTVISVLITANGRLVFARPVPDPVPRPRTASDGGTEGDAEGGSDPAAAQALPGPVGEGDPEAAEITAQIARAAARARRR